MVQVKLLLITTVESSRQFHHEVMRRNFGDTVICIFLLCGSVMGKEKPQNQREALPYPVADIVWLKICQLRNTRPSIKFCTLPH